MGRGAVNRELLIALCFLIRQKLDFEIIESIITDLIHNYSYNWICHIFVM